MEINKQITTEEAAERIFPDIKRSTTFGSKYMWTPKRERLAFIKGVQYQTERMYTEEEIYNLLYELLPDKQELDEWFKDKRK